MSGSNGQPRADGIHAVVTGGEVPAYGSAGRIGLILPADNVVIEPEFASLALPGITFHGLRLTYTTPERMRAQAVELSDALVEMGVDAAVYACAETSFNGGDAVRQSLSEMIADRCGLPVVTATNATLDAVRALALHKVAAVTPYTDRSDQLFEQTLAVAGAEVVSSVRYDFRAQGQDDREWFYTNRQPHQTVVDMALQADTAEAEAIVIGSTNWPTLQRLPELEQLTGKPVVSSNLSIIWWSLRQLGVSPVSSNLGQLMNLPTTGVAT